MIRALLIGALLLAPVAAWAAFEALVPGSAFQNETGAFEALVPGGVFMSESGASTAAPPFSSGGFLFRGFP